MTFVTEILNQRASCLVRTPSSLYSLSVDDSSNVTLGSFGSARSLYSQSFPRATVTRYCSPENVYTTTELKPSELKASDVWSLGIVFAEMLKGAPLFDAREKNALLGQVTNALSDEPLVRQIMRWLFIICRFSLSMNASLRIRS